MLVHLPRWAAARAGAAALVAALVMIVTAPAGASTIHACVRPHSGATRIVSAKAKCRHGEQKLSWSTTGPKGKTGPAGSPGSPGTPGTAGANGIGPAFTALGGDTPLSSTPALLLTKTVPPGDFFVTAPVGLRAEAAAAKFVSATCFVADKAGTSLANGDVQNPETTLLALNSWEVGLPETGTNEFSAEATTTLAGVLQSKVTSTLGIGCTDLDTPAGVTVKSVIAELVAVQVSSVG